MNFTYKRKFIPKLLNINEHDCNNVKLYNMLYNNHKLLDIVACVGLKKKQLLLLLYTKKEEKKTSRLSEIYFIYNNRSATTKLLNTKLYNIIVNIKL